MVDRYALFCCEKCWGEGVYECPHCNGDGLVPIEERSCCDCGDTGWLDRAARQRCPCYDWPEPEMRSCFYCDGSTLLNCDDCPNPDVIINDADVLGEMNEDPDMPTVEGERRARVVRADDNTEQIEVENDDWGRNWWLDWNTVRLPGVMDDLVEALDELSEAS